MSIIDHCHNYKAWAAIVSVGYERDAFRTGIKCPNIMLLQESYTEYIFSTISLLSSHYRHIIGTPRGVSDVLMCVDTAKGLNRISFEGRNQSLPIWRFTALYLLSLGRGRMIPGLLTDALY